LVVMVDLSPTAMHSPEDQKGMLLRELADYDPVLLTRPRIEVGSRADLDDGTWDWDGERVTAVTGDGVPELVGRMVQAVSDARQHMPEREAFVVHRLAGEGSQVARDETGTGWDVIGREAIRAVRLSDLTNPEA